MSIANPDLYEADTVVWANTNAELLRQRRFEELDIAHLIEELEDMGKSERRALESHLTVLMMHLLKWQHQRPLRGNSWKFSITNARVGIEDAFVESPSLRPKLADPAFVDRAYAKARRLASVETGLDISTFPQECPFDALKIESDWLPQ